MSGDRGWLTLVPVALVATGALAFAATWLGADRIESALADRAESALAAAGLPADDVRLDGRDVTVHGVPAGQADRAGRVVGGVDGVGEVTVARPSPAVEERHSARSQRRQLQQQVDAVLAQAPITFLPNSDVLTPQGEDSVAAVMRLIEAAPGDVGFEVGGHVAHIPGGDPERARALSRARAQTVADRFVAAGISADRVVPVGYGDTRPASDTGNPKRDRRVEITVL
jgi:outer membrane protein OmpA-like peptidoglycan-associated protein